MGEIAWQFGRFCGGHKDIIGWTERQNVIDRKTKRVKQKDKKNMSRMNLDAICFFLGIYVFMSKTFLSFCQ